MTERPESRLLAARFQPAAPISATADAGLYAHVPFCFHKCHYCDFYSLVDRPRARHEAFLARLIEELEWRNGQTPLRPRTVFVGGGTPTLLGAGCWQRLLAVTADLGILSQVVEFTVEANPETVDAALAETLAGGGVNRVSIGCQSFEPAMLEALERWHDPESVPAAVEAFRRAGIGDINLDLIFGIPGQDLAMVDADLDRALALEPTHLSCYGLTCEPGTPLRTLLDLGRVEPVDQDLAADMYERVLDRLAAAGFEHYEVSNWAGPGPPGHPPRRCRHNMVYWTNRNWLGCGPAAASHRDGHRWRNRPHLDRYLTERPEPPTTDHEHLSPERRVGEHLMLGLRLREGVARAWLDAHVPPEHPRRAAIRELLDGGLLEHTHTHLRLTRRGLLLADSVLARLV